jgi:hypothetical protein
MTTRRTTLLSATLDGRRTTCLAARAPLVLRWAGSGGRAAEHQKYRSALQVGRSERDDLVFGDLPVGNSTIASLVSRPCLHCGALGDDPVRPHRCLPLLAELAFIGAIAHFENAPGADD